MWFRPDPLEVKMDKATQDHYVYCQGFHDGKMVGMRYGDWLYRYKEGQPCPETDAIKHSPYRRLLKWLEREWRRRR